RFSVITFLCAAWHVCMAVLLVSPSPALAQNKPVRVIAFGAHPDDCDLGAGGIAAKYEVSIPGALHVCDFGGTLFRTVRKDKATRPRQRSQRISTVSR